MSCLIYFLATKTKFGDLNHIQSYFFQKYNGFLSNDSFAYKMHAILVQRAMSPANTKQIIYCTSKPADNTASQTADETQGIVSKIKHVVFSFVSQGVTFLCTKICVS